MRDENHLVCRVTSQCETATATFVSFLRCVFVVLYTPKFQRVPGADSRGTPEMLVLRFILPVGLVHIVRNFAVAAAMSGNQDYKSATSIYDFTANSIKGEEVPLSKYKGHVCVIVNVASKCGLTATNYKELNELYDEYAESKGLRILAFPCNQFNGQEPGSSEEICSFADRQKVKFDLFEKIDVNGDKTHPLWSYLKKEQGGLLGNFIKWNFTKFIVDKEGKVVERHGPNVDPHKLKDSLEKYF